MEEPRAAGEIHCQRSLRQSVPCVICLFPGSKPCSVRGAKVKARNVAARSYPPVQRWPNWLPQSLAQGWSGRFASNRLAIGEMTTESGEIATSRTLRTPMVPSSAATWRSLWGWWVAWVQSATTSAGCISPPPPWPRPM